MQEAAFEAARQFVSGREEELYTELAASEDPHVWLETLGMRLVEEYVTDAALDEFAAHEVESKKEYASARYLDESGQPNALFRQAARWSAVRCSCHTICSVVHAMLFTSGVQRDINVRTRSYRSVTSIDSDSLWQRVRLE